MYILLIIIVAIVSGLLCFVLPKQSKVSNVLLLLNGILTLGISWVILPNAKAGASQGINFEWLPDFNASFSLASSPISVLLCLLCGLCFIILALITNHIQIKNSNSFYGLCLLSLAGLVGVFNAYDALLFYIFWELALIPVYFLCSMWGDEHRVKVSFKFFIYTFVGSLVMLVGLLYIYTKTPDHSFSWQSFEGAQLLLTNTEQTALFIMMFIAFAIKMPIFPLHTWQPETYNQTYTPVTMILSAVMVKMGLFGVYTWLMPILPNAFISLQPIIIALCVIGIVYASLLALVQDNIKKIAAYSSIAHIGLMCAALFSNKSIGIQGALVQMFSHGVNIIGMWMLVFYLERHFGTKNIHRMGGIASTNQSFTIFLVIITLANIALPLTNGFPGEFMMFNGLYNSGITYSLLFTILAGLGIILSAVYSLNMVQKVAFGESKSVAVTKLSIGEWLGFIIITALILIFGFYPQFILNLFN
jgi:NADH-quinone oxidoreductase subunit M